MPNLGIINMVLHYIYRIEKSLIGLRKISGDNLKRLSLRTIDDCVFGLGGFPLKLQRDPLL